MAQIMAKMAQITAKMAQIMAKMAQIVAKMAQITAKMAQITAKLAQITAQKSFIVLWPGPRKTRTRNKNKHCLGTKNEENKKSVFTALFTINKFPGGEGGGRGRVLRAP
jgi:hypothetical protein